MDSQKAWNVALAKCHYRIDRWGLQHFDINPQGNVVVKTAAAEIELFELGKSLRSNGTDLPVLVRFPQILQQSLSKLSLAFKEAIKANRYSGDYIAAYPIKVNQQATVIQYFQQQTQWPIAFEVGSKAELIACLGLIDTQQTIICNGYKDEIYIRLALIAALLGHEIVIVIESLTEFRHVLKQSFELDMQPKLGMRVRLNSIAKGNWQNTGGKHSKFGLTSNEVLSLVKEMQDNDALTWMKMLHFHMGSQISCLQNIQAGVQEGMHFFAQLEQHGVKFEQLNIGGGLAVDYEGSCSDAYFSMDYSINDYANTVINTVHLCCEKFSLAAPTIYSENGRAMTAHHAVLITNVLDIEYQDVDFDNAQNLLTSTVTCSANLSLLIEHVKIIDTNLNDKDSKSVIESYARLNAIAENIEKEFAAGELLLAEKAIAERLACYAFWKLLDSKSALSEEDQTDIEDKFIAKYFCNFSLFQSVPDIWGLGQIFPIIPLHRNNEFPAIKSRIYDLTCDSDGRVDRYVEADSVQPYLSMHAFKQQQDYFLGIFLVGAYQEILGDMHNLFGDTNTVNIVLNTDGSYQICDEEPGDTIAEILSYLHIDTVRMRQIWLDRLSHNNVSEHKRKIILDELEASLHTNSYLS